MSRIDKAFELTACVLCVVIFVGGFVALFVHEAGEKQRRRELSDLRLQVEVAKANRVGTITCADKISGISEAMAFQGTPDFDGVWSFYNSDHGWIKTNSSCSVIYQ